MFGAPLVEPSVVSGGLIKVRVSTETGGVQLPLDEVMQILYFPFLSFAFLKHMMKAQVREKV